MSEKPLVFVVGDSISMQYGPFLERYLGDDFRYARKSGEEEALKDLDHPQGANGGDSSMVREYIQRMVGDPDWQPDVLVLNCGLHDIKADPESGEKQVPIAQYRENLLTILGLLGSRSIPLIWVRTTPVDDEQHNSRSSGFHRFAADVRDYNAAADSIMASVGVPLIDLHDFTANQGDNVFCDHVHFNEDVREAQGNYIARWIRDYFVLKR
ncbi:MAG: SGNH/GDSL hydrolase family protein [Candidatus Sumerlaeota bacterium]